MDNQKNGWKGICVFHESNGEKLHCPVCVLARRYLHLCNMGTDAKMFLSAYYDDKGQRRDITSKDVSIALKAAPATLDYPTAKGIPINCIDTHSL